MKKNGKIAFVSNTSWSVYNFRLGIIKRLLALGLEVIIIAPNDDYSQKLKDLGCHFFPLSLDNYSTNPLKDIRTTFQLWNLYRQLKPDYIFHYTIKPNFYGTIAAFLNGIPSIAITTGLGHLFFSNPIVTFITTNLYRLTGKLTKEIWFLNESDRITFIEKELVAPEKTFLLPSEGVNIEHFSPQPRRTFSNKTIFLYAGRMLKNKGVALLEKASNILQQRGYEIEVQLLGDISRYIPNGITPEQLNRWQIEGHIRYLGITADVRPFIANADCIVFPSYYGEGISRILLESASMEKAIISTDHVGCREVVEDGKNGFLIPIKNVVALVKAMEQFLSLNATDRKAMGKFGREKVKREFEEEKIISIYLEKIACQDKIPVQ